MRRISPNHRERLETALELARDGFRILPVKPNLREPAIKKWVSRATTNESTIEDWFDEFPDMNYGMLGGSRSGVFILDADLDKLADPDEGWLLSARETYTRLVRDYELDLDDTLTVRTPSGGFHHYFEWPEGIEDSYFVGHRAEHPNLGRGMDFEAAGGMVLGPGSVADGKTYEALDLTAPLAKMPHQLILDLRKRSPKKETERSNVGKLKDRPNNSKSKFDVEQTNPAYVEKSIDKLREEMNAFSSGEGSRDNDAWHAARQLAKWVVTPGSGIDETTARNLYLDGTAHMVGDDFTEQDVESKWDRAMTGAWPVSIPAPSRTVGRPTKPKTVPDDEKSRLYKDGILMQSLVAEYMIEKWSIVAEDGNGLWYYDNEAHIFRSLNSSDRSIAGPRSDIARILIGDNTFSQTRVSTFVGVIQEMSSTLPKIDLGNRSTDNIPLRNGVLDRRTRKLLPHNPETSSTFIWPITYDTEAECPLNDRQVELTMAEDAHAFFWEFMASILFPSTIVKTKKAWMLYGTGGNGKSLWLRLVERILGEDAVSGIPLGALDDNNPFKLEALRGKRAQIDDDVSKAVLKDAAAMKKLIDGNPVWGEEKGKQGSLLRFHGSMAFGTNNLLAAPEYTDGWFRRWMYLHFPNDLSDLTSQFDEETLRSDSELSGVFNRALSALDRVEGQGFTVPSSSKRLERLFQSRGKSGLIKEWLNDATNGITVDESDLTLRMTTGQTWIEFKEWASRNGFNERDLPGRNSEFHDFMERRFKHQRYSTGGDHYLGIQPIRKLRAVDEHFIPSKSRKSKKSDKPVADRSTGEIIEAQSTPSAQRAGEK